MTKKLLITLSIVLLTPSLVFAQSRGMDTVQDQRPSGSQVICTMEYAPVCGVDGETYPNDCVARQQNNVEIEHRGVCESDQKETEDEDENEERDIEPNMPDRDRSPFSNDSRFRDLRDNVRDTFQRVISPTSTREEIRERHLQLIQERREFGQEISERARALRDLPDEERREAAQRLTEERRQEARENSEVAKQIIEEKRQAYLERIQNQRQEFTEKIQTIQDEQKKEIAQRLRDNLHNINERLLNSLSNRLSAIENILINITTRADKIEANGENVDEAREAITIAEESLAEARIAITEQFDKSYSIEFNDESDLGNAMRELRQEMINDLDTIRTLVNEVRDQTRSALNILAQIPESLED